MIKEHRITEMLYEKCEKVLVKPGEWVCRCPLCGDSKTKPNARRFHIDWYPKYGTFMYKCHRCGESNNVYMLCSELYDMSYKEARRWMDDTKYDVESIKKIVSNDTVDVDTNIVSELDIDIKRDCFSVNDNPSTRNGKNLVNRLKKFIDDRQLTEPTFISHTGRYKGRIIIPVINNKKLEYFQGRALYDDIDPKYLNPFVDKTPIIYHQYDIDPERDIIITEGLIDAQSVGSQCTSTLGADISDEKLEHLFELTNKTIILCMDNDSPGKASLKKFSEKSKYKKIVKYFIMPKKLYYAKDMNFLLTDCRDVIGNISIEDFIIKNSFSYFYVKTLLKIK